MSDATKQVGAFPRLVMSVVEPLKSPSRRDNYYCTGSKKTPGGAGTHTGHTGHADAQRHSDHIPVPRCLFTGTAAVPLLLLL
jgi:hypothetical protein